MAGGKAGFKYSSVEGLDGRHKSIPPYLGLLPAQQDYSVHRRQAPSHSSPALFNSTQRELQRDEGCLAPPALLGWCGPRARRMWFCGCERRAKDSQSLARPPQGLRHAPCSGEGGGWVLAPNVKQLGRHSSCGLCGIQPYVETSSKTPAFLQHSAQYADAGCLQRRWRSAPAWGVFWRQRPPSFVLSSFRHFVPDPASLCPSSCAWQPIRTCASCPRWSPPCRGA